MHILMTTDTVGGVWTYCVQLARALQPLGVQFFLAAKGRPSDDQIETAEALENVTLVMADYKLEWMKDPWRDVQEAGKWLFDLARALQPDLVHLNDYCHASLPWKVPTLVVGHSCVVSWIRAVRGESPGSDWNRYRREVKRALARADLVVAPSRHMLYSLEQNYGRMRSRQVIHNGCGPGGFQSGRKQRLIFSAGRLWDDAKNLQTLAAAAPYLDWPVHVAGLPHPDGRDGDVDSVRTMTWLGRLSTAEMAATYARASIYALPALYEPFGLTVLEAALSGCALVLGDIPTLRENWSGAALFVPPRDVRSLVHAINRLARDGTLRRQLTQSAGERARELTAARMAEAYYRSYRHLSTQVPAVAVA